MDIYRVFLFNKVSVAGQLLDSANNPVSDAQVNIKYDSVQLKTYTDANGAYELLVPIYKEMKLTFEKDDRQLHEGEYIAHVFFRDKNDNSYNFYFENTEDDEEGIANSSGSEVKHINVKVRNDYAENLIIDNVPIKEEIAWADSLNVRDSVEYAQDLIRREEASKFVKETVSVSSENLEISDMVIIKKITETIAEAKEGEEQPEVISDRLYTVQILAVTLPRKPDASYFEKLDPNSIVLHSEGNDGLDRFYSGEYDSRRNAVRAMRVLRKNGYPDAFVRKIKKYQEL